MPGSLQEPSEERRAFRSNPDTGHRKNKNKNKNKKESPWNRELGPRLKFPNLRWWQELFLKIQELERYQKTGKKQVWY